jgi:cytochrome P450
MLAFNEVQRIQCEIFMMTYVVSRHWSSRPTSDESDSARGSPFDVFYPKADYHRQIKNMEAFITPFIERTLALPADELDKLTKSDTTFTFLHHLAKYSQDPKVIRDQLVAVLLAARDTTAGTLSWAFYELSAYPEKWTRLRREVLSALGGPTRAPTYDDLKNMKYLRYAINETLRLYPAVPYNVRTALKDTTLPGVRPGQPDIAVLAGDQVLYQPLKMQRRADLYPPTSDTFADPALFSPERWFEWTPKSWDYIPFNGGPRIVSTTTRYSCVKPRVDDDTEG